MGSRYGIVVLVAALCGLASGPAPAAPPVRACDTAGITVSAASPEEARMACDVAAETGARLGRFGLRLHAPVRIEITEHLDAAPGTCVALYSTEERKLQVLPVDCLEGQPGRASAFPRMRPELLFESLIVHELAHAYMDQAAQERFLPRVAYEYFAYAVQLDALPEADRSRILAKAAVGPPVDFEQINDAVLNLSPLRFAAMSWLHFKREGGDAALVQRILTGKLLFNSLEE